ncbi:uncharacterized protein LDX57_011207 [Aspergillus melleus]|uniref:uncharacterized protein n=1 Tax=Aspergillus melleus TaxID=138277 RepID=UPI001E8E01DF|nr:uncharacterized protein LDX57_011207 [Aspergillus melleus]KAH8433573.1 hypothetical protein LDX57_011207 [Aspergillus melleus]
MYDDFHKCNTILSDGVIFPANGRIAGYCDFPGSHSLFCTFGVVTCIYKSTSYHGGFTRAYAFSFGVHDR